MNGQREAREAGFTLVELMIAVVVTLIITGAMFGLMTTGQNAFRREPEVTDRQQNIRVGMNLISRDVITAGVGMDPFVQAFTQGLDGAGPAGSMGAAYQAARGDASANSDILEILLNDGTCPTMTVAGGVNTGANFFALEQVPACFNLPAFVYVSGTGGAGSNNPPYPAGLMFGFQRGGIGHVNVPHGLSPYNPNPGGGGLCPAANTCQNISIVSVVRYMIAGDASDGLPSLWRNPYGTSDLTGATGVLPPVAPWQLVARGIDDLQVEYQNGGGVWQNDPGAVDQTPARNFTTLVQKVRITLAARSSITNVQGGTAGAVGPATLRGQLVVTVSPRAALEALQNNGGTLWR